MRNIAAALILTTLLPACDADESPVDPRAEVIGGCEYENQLNWNDDHMNLPSHCAMKAALCFDSTASDVCDLAPEDCYEQQEHCMLLIHGCWKSTGTL